MAEDRISSIVAPSAFQEIDQLKAGISDASKLLVDLNKTASTIELRLGDTKTVMQLNELLKELGATTEQVKQITLDQAKAVNQLAQAEQKRSAAEVNTEKAATQKIRTQREELRLEQDLLRNKERLEAAAKREQKAIIDLSNDYGMLSKAYNEAALRAKNYGLQHGENHPITLQAINDAKAMGDTLKRLDASVGQYQRNVGNYNMVGAQFNQLLRELPNAGQSLNIFVMALSNNLSYFVESVKAARDAGQSYGQILLGLGKNLFSVVGITNILILAFTLWSKAAQDNARKTKELNKELTETEKLSKEYAQTAAKETSQLRILYEVATRANTSYQNRVAAIAQLQEKYPAYFANLTTEEFLAGKAAAAYLELGNAIFMRARASALTSRFNALAERELEINEKLAEIDKTRNKVKNDGNTFTVLSLEEETKLLKSAAERKVLEAELTDIRQKQSDYVGKIAELTDVEVKERQKVTATLREQVALQLRLASGTGEVEQPDIIASPEATRVQQLMLEEQQRLRMLQASYEGGLITYKQYQEGREKIANTITREIIRLQVLETQALLANTRLTVEQRRALEEQLTKLLAMLREAEGSTVTGEKAKQKAMEETLKLLQTYIGAFNDIASISSIQADAQIQNLQKQIDMTQRASEEEIRAINRSGKSQTEKEKAIQEAEARTAARRKFLEQQQQQQQQRQAQYEKQLAIMNIILATAINVARAKTIPEKIAQGVAGAAQLAVAIATPIPQYAIGTLDHKGGYAEVAEKEPELIKEPGKRPYMVNKNAILDLPKHTQVFNQEQMYAMLTPQMIAMLQGNRADSRNYEKLEHAIVSTGKATIRAIAQNRAIQNVNIQGRDDYYLRNVKRR
jgi:hypothetical protein